MYNPFWKGVTYLKINKECIIDILSVLGGEKSELFEIKYDKDGNYKLPLISVYDIKNFFNDKYSFELLSYCCWLLLEEGYIIADIKTDLLRGYFSVNYLYGLTLKGYEYLETLNNKL